ncbi:MAG: MBL fold metallo-hydrolase [Gammaproteobacteria bacterium]|nr:MAG: MBL fold metallo-hydrolase [Gammaproteobacteria bacterium]RLA52257.1 MAG: MBL fold metallo-hydrolase [Gammaproteobacteria bacterium]
MKFAVIPVTPFQQNCSLLWCEETMLGAVIDPGGDMDRIEQRLQQENVTLEKVLVTHGHMDHAGAVADMAEKYKVPIEGPQKEESFWIDKLPEQGKMFGLNGTFRSFEPDRWLEEGDTVTVGKEILEVYHCPGHTPGHIAFFCRNARLAIVGDLLFQGSIGRTDFPKGNFDTLIKSITEKLWPLGDDVAFIPGHGPMSTFGQERKMNAFVSDYALA